MRTLILLPLLGSIATHAQIPDHLWSTTMPNAQTIGFEGQFTAYTVTSEDNVFAFATAADPGQTFYVQDRLSPNPGIVRFNENGQLLWVKPANGTFTSMDSGDNDHVYVAGAFSGTQQFGGTSLTAQGQDAYLARYNAVGDLVWVQQLGGPGLDQALDVTVDGQGMVHVAGMFRGASILLSGTTLTATHDSTTGFLATYDASGALAWAVNAGGSNEPADLGMGTSDFQAVAHSDATGHTYVFGRFTDTGDFGGTMLSAVGVDDLFLARYDAGGGCDWVKRFGSMSERSNAASVGTNGSGVYIHGSQRGALDIEGTVLSNPNGDDPFLAYFSAAGTLQWAQPVAPTPVGSTTALPNDMAITSAGNAWISLQYNCDLIPCPVGSYSLMTTSGSESAIALFDPTGACIALDSIMTSEFAPGDMDLFSSDELCMMLGDDAGPTGGNTLDFTPPTSYSIGLINAGSGCIAAFDGALDLRWYRLASPHRAAFDHGTACTLVPGGGSLVLSSFTGTQIHCGDTLDGYRSERAIAISKRDANGDCTWSRMIASRNSTGVLPWSGACDPGGTSTSASGDIYVCGAFSDTTDIGSLELVSAGGQDAFLAKYDAAGTALWATRSGGTGTDGMVKVRIAPNGDVLAIAWYTGTVDVQGDSFTSAGGTDGLLLRYDDSGILIWARSFGGPNNDAPTDLGIDDAGNVIITGQFRASAVFGTENLTGTGGLIADGFVVRYDPAGDAQWARALTGAGFKTAAAISVHPNGQCHVTGSFTQDIDFGTNSQNGAGFNYRMFLAAFDAAGNDQWAQQFQTSGSSQGRAIDRRPGGDILLGGEFSGDITFGATSLSNGGATSMALAAFDPSGTALWAISADQSSDASSSIYAIDSDWNAVIAGGTFGNVIFGNVAPDPGSITFDTADPASTHSAPNLGDPFLAAFVIEQSTLVTDHPGHASITVRPNPVSDRLIVSAIGLWNEANLAVMDMSGRTLITERIHAARNTMLNVSCLAPGGYLLRTSTGLVVRFLKQ